MESRRKFGKQLVFLDASNSRGETIEIKVSAPPLAEKDMNDMRATIKCGDVVQAKGDISVTTRNGTEMIMFTCHEMKIVESWADVHGQQVVIFREELTCEANLILSNV